MLEGETRASHVTVTAVPFIDTPVAVWLPSVVKLPSHMFANPSAEAKVITVVAPDGSTVRSCTAVEIVFRLSDEEPAQLWKPSASAAMARRLASFPRLIWGTSVGVLKAGGGATLPRTKSRSGRGDRDTRDLWGRARTAF